MWRVDVLAAFWAMCTVRTRHDVASTQLLVDVDRPLEVAVQRCLPGWEYSEMLMRRHMMWPGIDVVLREEVVFIMKNLLVLPRKSA